MVNVFLRHESKILSEFLMVVPTSPNLPNMLFAKTIPVESALNSLILNISIKKPTLLVGETGAGKTALVQYLCSNSEHFFGYKVSLKIINMSMDFDGFDLIGGYHSIDLDQKIKEMYTKIQLEIPRSLNRRNILEQLLLKLTTGLSSKFDIDTNISNTTTSNCIQSMINEVKLYLSILDKKLPFYFRDGALTQAMKNGTWVLLDEINLSSDETLNLIEAILSKDEMILYESGDFTPIKIHPNFMIFACMNPHGDFGKKKYDSSVFSKIVFYDFSFSLKVH
ncbi:uncharacterized protein VICG_01540 [Vittaforma corneae ATCC 50505]|uniref:ATPase dynein-related AAA domain-containing protein n=1 Tax=Vittaforma corneae (strain ATCC 50505) TaxID=993615 RepID=L2GLQ6_VITCO|nr:uncharacterized protein VICG_01540 [Vittaforma corneae ATCC 50505]ELA41435.1 hypothetical protein VICG_01540 [Vittaforma corneae ATCC 50505]